MPEYSLAIDLYQTLPDGLTGSMCKSMRLLQQSMRRRRGAGAGSSICIDRSVRCAVGAYRVRLRRKTPRGEQYSKLNEQSTFRVVEEGGLKFRVNFDDYLIPGCFLTTD